MQIARAPRHITGRHGRRLEDFAGWNSLCRKRAAKALAAYKAQRIEGRAFQSGPSEKARKRAAIFNQWKARLYHRGRQPRVKAA